MSELTVEEKVSAKLSADYAASLGTPTVVAPIVENVVAAPVDVQVVDSVIPVVKAETVVDPIIPVIPEPVKSFEDLLAERSGGKFKSWKEIESELTPKEVFANEKIKHLNELASKGIDVTSREFLELQSVDFDKLDKADDILFEKWKRSDEGKGLSNDTIRHEINKKYNVEEWIDKDPSELTLDDKANREKMARDSGESKQWLINYKNERVLEKQVDPAVSKAMADEYALQLSNWDKFVDSDLVNKVAKTSSPISYKDETGKVIESKFDFEFSKESLIKAGEMMKNLPRDSNMFFDQFKDDKGNRNHEALALMKLKADNFDKAMALSYAAGAEQRALVIEKTSKNTNFKPAEAAVTGKVFTTIAEAQADAIKNMKI